MQKIEEEREREKRKKEKRGRRGKEERKFRSGKPSQLREKLQILDWETS